MRILIGHNYYAQAGGEDSVARAEKNLLERHGHPVSFFEKNNHAFIEGSFADKVGYLLSMTYSKKVYRDIRSIIKQFKPNVAHFHNIFYRITPAAYYACHDANVPVVQTLHNFRLLCLNALFFKDGMPCERCLGQSFSHGIRRRCFQDSFVRSYWLARMLKIHQRKGTWTQMIDRYITLSHFSKKKFIEAGYPEAKFVVKPNFTPLPESEFDDSGRYALYVGRLSSEKGIMRLVHAWPFSEEYRLTVVGDGPLRQKIQKYMKQESKTNIVLKGFLDEDQCNELIAKARYVIVPSLCYENFPKVIAQAFARKVPVLGSNRGSVKEIVKDGRNGKLFDPDNPEDLSDKIIELFENEDNLATLKQNAFKDYNEKYSPKVNYRQLTAIYESVSE
jgi:glycosyltransferase involved in cell wall biosynthesis